MLGKEVFDGLEIIVGCKQGVPNGMFRNPWSSGQGESGQSGACLGQQTVHMSMVASYEFDDLAFASCGSGQAKRRHGRFCARIDHPDHVYAGKGVNNQFGQGYFMSGWGSKT
jgi:hypothetical protein